uniref:Uncharacterized protein n=1 Tax=Eutreptiella gymnastica TaxID=73025 RepID=A0A7S4G6W9_9EUGL
MVKAVNGGEGDQTRASMEGICQPTWPTGAHVTGELTVQEEEIQSVWPPLAEAGLPFDVSKLQCYVTTCNFCKAISWHSMPTPHAHRADVLGLTCKGPAMHWVGGAMLQELSIAVHHLVEAQQPGPQKRAPSQMIRSQSHSAPPLQRNGRCRR